MELFLDSVELRFLLGFLLAIFIGYAMGAERESRSKDAGISTHILVISGSMLFTLIGAAVDTESITRIAAGVVTGIGFLGAGLILREGLHVRNLTTAASLWFAAAIGVALGFGFYLIAAVAGLAAALIPRIPAVKHGTEE